ncbi:MAG: hypothetical protein ABIJ09_25135 [Pseudomonadota bacterium]
MTLRPMSPVWLLAASLLVAPLRAEELPRPGPWRVDRVKLEIQADPWAPSCGPVPKGHDWKVSADEFELTVKEGELRFASKRRVISSTGCEAQSKHTKPQNHDTRDGVRVTECAAPEIQGLAEEQLRHAFQLVDGEHVLYVTEGSRLQLPPNPPDEEQLGEVRSQELVWYSDGESWKQGTRLEAQRAQRCVLKFRREEKLERVPERAAACASAGPPRSLEFDPATADITAGATRCFEVRAKDLEGCPATSPPVQFKVAPAELAMVDGRGCVIASRDLQEAAAVALTAEAPGLRASALLRLTPATTTMEAGATQDAAPAVPEATPDLETLVQRSSNARVREVAAELVGAIRVGELSVRSSSQASTPTSLHASPADQGSGFGWVLGLVGLVLVVGSGVVALLFRRRLRSVREAEALAADAPHSKVYEAEMAGKATLPEQGKGLVCPTCKFEFESGTFCPFDRSALVPLDRDARHTLFIPISGGMICPVCKTRYPSKARFCGKDRSPLIPDLG